MNEVHFHLVLNHFPVMGTLFGFVLLLHGSLRANVTVLNVAFSTLVFSGIASALTYASGLLANDAAMLSEGQKSLAASHELAGEMATYASVLLGLAVWPVYLQYKEKRVSAAKWTMLLLLFTFLVLGMMVWAAWSGGRIQH